MIEDKNDSIHELITRYMTGEASAAEKAQLDSWRAEQADHENLFNQFKRSLEKADQHAKASQQVVGIDVEQEWRQFQQNVQRPAGKEVKLPAAAPTTNWLRVAAALLILVSAAWLVNYFVSRSAVEVFQSQGEALALTLPDGSSVVLNKNSELRYDRSFGDEVREVSLRGEAFFDVTRNEKIPFRIRAGNATVQVLGTSFNVRGYEAESVVEVVVATGSVQLSGAGGKAIQLKPGEKGQYDRTSQQITQAVNADPNFIAWKTRQLQFEATDLRAVVDAINRAYGSHLVVAANISPSCVLTASFDHQSLEAVLRVLESTLQLTYRKQGDTIEIVSAGC